MDPRTFDSIVKALSQPRSRRSVVAGALGTALSTLTHLADDARGKRGGQRRGKSKRRGAKHDKQRNGKKDRKQAKGQAGAETCIALGQTCRKHREPCCDGARCRTLLGLPLITGRCRCPEGTRDCAGECIPVDACCAADGTGNCPPCDVCASGCPFTSVQAAVDAADPDATLTICAGTYVETVTITQDLTLIGVGDGADPASNTILDGAGAGPVVTIATGQTVALQQLRVTGGSADSGGGILNQGGTLSLSGCTVSGNSGGFGGGVDNEDGALTVSDSTVSGNTATQLGGGLFVDGASTVTLTNSIVSDNTAGQEGGGIATDDVVTLTLANCTVRGNISGLGGGGIFSVGDVTLTGSTVRDNTANDDGFGIHGDGGGILNSVAGLLTLEASTVTGNHAAIDGGGIANAGTVACSADSTVSGNTAGTAGTENCFDDLALGGSGCATCPRRRIPAAVI